VGESNLAEDCFATKTKPKKALQCIRFVTSATKISIGKKPGSGRKKEKDRNGFTSSSQME